MVLRFLKLTALEALEIPCWLLRFAGDIGERLDWWIFEQYNRPTRD